MSDLTTSVIAMITPQQELHLTAADAILAELDEQTIAVLKFEQQWMPHPGSASAKAVAIKRILSLTPGRYWQILNQALDRREVEAWDPLLIRRLQRMRNPHAAVAA